MIPNRPDPVRIAATNAALRILEIQPHGADLITKMVDVIADEIRFMLDRRAAGLGADEICPITPVD